jgi:hypothetical protein
MPLTAFWICLLVGWLVGDEESYKTTWRNRQRDKTRRADATWFCVVQKNNKTDATQQRETMTTTPSNDPFHQSSTTASMMKIIVKKLL